MAGGRRTLPLFELLRADRSELPYRHAGRPAADSSAHPATQPPGSPAASQAHAQAARPPGQAQAAAHGTVASPMNVPTVTVRSVAPRANGVAVPDRRPTPATDLSREPQAAGRGWSWSASSVVSVRMSAVYMALIVVLVVLVGAWAVAYNLGYAESGRDLEPWEKQAGLSPPIDDPTRPAVRPDPAEDRTGSPPDSQATNRPVQPLPAPAAGPGDATPTGLYAFAGRLTPGLNYLVVGTFTTQAEAERLRNELRGAETALVPVRTVDNADKPIKNAGPRPERFLVVFTRGITGTQYRNRDPELVAAERAAADMGIASAYWKRLDF